MTFFRFSLSSISSIVILDFDFLFIIRYGINEKKSPISYLYNLKTGIAKFSSSFDAFKIYCLIRDEIKKIKIIYDLYEAFRIIHALFFVSFYFYNFLF